MESSEDTSISGAITVGILIFVGVIVLQNSFGVLCASHSMSEILNLLIVCGWTSYVAVCDPSQEGSYLSLKFGQAAAGLCLITSYTVLLKALNRFMAFSIPVIYFKWFSTNAAIFCIAVVWILGILHLIPFFFEGCEFMLDSQNFLWGFSNSICGNFYAFYIDFLYSFIIMAFVLIFDGLTLISLMKFRQHFTRSTNFSTNIKKRDIYFFVQSCGTTFIQIFMLLSFHLLSRFATTSWERFFSTTFAWASCSSADGVFNVILNIRINQQKIMPKTLIHAPKVERKIESTGVSIIVN